MANMISLKINGQDLEVQTGSSILDACKAAGIIVPRFCYHETLSIAGNCRMCLVEVEGVEKPVASCLTEVSDNMIVFTESIFAKKARENVLETLLINHPLDCPICDQAGECDLQDQTKSFASSHSKFLHNKRGVEDKNCGVLIKTIMTRCIHCTRCVRFSSEVAGVDFLGTFNRGSATEIGGYSENFFKSEISGNVIDLCPVGALTSQPFGYKARPWELRVNESIDTTDSTGSNMYIYFKDNQISRILPKSNEFINGQLITDAARFSYDSSINNRLKHIFCYKSGTKKERSINWTRFFKKTDETLKKDKVLVNFNDDIGVEAMIQLKDASRASPKFEICSSNGKINNDNFYFWGLTDRIKSIDICDSFGLTFSVDPKVQCAVINARLRSRCLNSLLSFVSMNLSYNSNIVNRSLNLSLSKSLKIIEGKNFSFANKLNLAESPLILIGESLKKRGLGFISLTGFLKSKFDTIKIIKVNATANSESIDFLNLQAITAKKNSIAETIMYVNLDDTLTTRKSFYGMNKKIYWFNTHKFDFQDRVSIKVPLLSEYEEDKLFLNLEQRPQKTNNTFKKFFDSRSFKRILSSMFSNNININIIDEAQRDRIFSKLSYITFIYEIIKSPWKFDALDNNFTHLILEKKVSENKINFLIKYPTKLFTENFFSSNRNLKNSLIMVESAKTYWNTNFSY